MLQVICSGYESNGKIGEFYSVTMIKNMIVYDENSEILLDF